MFAAILNLIAGWAVQQIQRFGWWVLAVPGVIVLLLVGLIVRGWASQSEKNAHGGMTEEQWKKVAAQAANEETVKPAAQREAAAKKAAEVKAALAKAKAAVAKSAPATAAKAPEATLLPVAPARPANLAKWNKEDFLRARSEGDAILPAAITELANRSVGSRVAAAFLVSMIEPDARPASTASRSPGAEPKRLVDSIVAALASNGTDGARDALRAIVRGKLDTLDDRAATESAIRAITMRRDRSDEDLLISALATPETLRPPKGQVASPPGFEQDLAHDKGLISAQELQALAVAALQSTGSESLRLRLAQYLTNPETSVSIRQCLIGCLAEPRVENLAAQVVLYASEEIDPKVRAALEQNLTAWSTEALGHALGLSASQRAAITATPPAGEGMEEPVRPGWASVSPPPTARLAAGGGKPLDPSQTARCLWTNEFAEILDRRLSMLDSLGKSQGALRLAVSVPCPAARAAVRKTLSKYWYEGARVIESGVPRWDAVTDPGLMLVLKSMPRKGLSNRTLEPRAKKSSKYVTAKPTKPVKPNSEVEVKRKRELVEEWWIQRSESLARNWCQRLHIAATARGGQASYSPDKDVMPGLPISLHSDRTATVCHCEWPGSLAAATPEAARDPLDVYYIRIEERNRPARVAGFYRRQLNSFEDRNTQRGVWLDCFEEGSHAGRKRSIDVFVSKAAPDIPSLRDEELDLIVEVLWIEGS
jgi:hypothetical protein